VRHFLTLGVLVVAVMAGGTTASATPVRTMSLGSTYVVNGQTGTLDGGTMRATGLVVVRGKWAKGMWHVLTTTRTDARGRYRFALKPAHRGLLAVRITPPDRRDVRFLLRVV
jgi:hypothetical protein